MTDHPHTKAIQKIIDENLDNIINVIKPQIEALSERDPGPEPDWAILKELKEYFT